MIKFRTQYERERVTSELGSSVVATYALCVNDDGSRELKQVGEKDLYGEIQSHKESVDIKSILTRYANGDVSALNQRVGMFIDATQFPKTYAEMYQRIQEGENFFKELPVEIRAEFNHNPMEFFSAIGTEKFSAFMDKYGKVEQAAPPDQSAAVVVDQIVSGNEE